MATQVWFHTGLTQNGLPKEPPVGYETNAVTTSNVAVDVPAVAGIAVVETDAAVAYRVNRAAVYANDPIIPSTGNSRYVIDVSGAATLNFIGTA
jgi:hypothetical protein